MTVPLLRPGSEGKIKRMHGAEPLTGRNGPCFPPDVGGEGRGGVWRGAPRFLLGLMGVFWALTMTRDMGWVGGRGGGLGGVGGFVFEKARLEVVYEQGS